MIPPYTIPDQDADLWECGCRHDEKRKETMRVWNISLLDAQTVAIAATLNARSARHRSAYVGSLRGIGRAIVMSMSTRHGEWMSCKEIVDSVTQLMGNRPSNTRARQKLREFEEHGIVVSEVIHNFRVMYRVSIGAEQ